MKNNNLPKLEPGTSIIESAPSLGKKSKTGFNTVVPEKVKAALIQDLEQYARSLGKFVFQNHNIRFIPQKQITFRTYKDFKGEISVQDEIYTKISDKHLEIKQYNRNGDILFDFEDGGLYPLYFGNDKAIIYLGEFLCINKIVYKDEKNAWYTIYKFYKQ